LTRAALACGASAALCVSKFLTSGPAENTAAAAKLFRGTIGAVNFLYDFHRTSRFIRDTAEARMPA
jgi:hypothetical protein